MSGLTYKKAGVDIGLADRWVKKIAASGAKVGGFSGLFPLDKAKTDFIAATTDGVGTKLKLAFMANKHDTVGIDLVAMSVNDLIAVGAEPLFFLDYYATGKLDYKASCAILEGILEGCRRGRMTLLGGETAEMPGFYPKGEYDLAGFAVGRVKKKDLITGREVRRGDVVLGIPSSGLHSNGFSLVRKLLGPKETRRMARELLTPTRIYVSELEKLKRRVRVLALAHITGGGIPGNLVRVLPKGAGAEIYVENWEIPKIFAYLQYKGKLHTAECFKTWNMGLGMCAVIREADADAALKALPDASIVGRITRGAGVKILT